MHISPPNPATRSSSRSPQRPPSATMPVSRRGIVHFLFAASVVLLLPGHALGQGPSIHGPTGPPLGPGEIHCPCVWPDWPHYSLLASYVTSAGLPAGYGMQGCQPYDAKYNQSGCGGSGTQPEHCEASWCYVDPEACMANATQCWDAGLMLNNPSIPACRSRSMDKSSLYPEAAPAYYSYQTCGSLNNYDVSRHLTNMKGSEIITTTTQDAPYTTRDEKEGSDGFPVVTFGGVQVDFMRSVLTRFQPAMGMEIVDGWATAGSRAKFSSSYTAAVHDVAVGNFDIAIGDFWVTSERMLLTNFLPAVRSDNFYLVVFEEGGSTSFAAMLQNPFQPFSGAAWGMICAAVVVSASAMAIVDFQDQEEFPYEDESFILRGGKAMYLGFLSLMGGASAYRAGSLPSKIITLGFQLFLVIVMASYTANLASLLVVKNVQTGVNSIYDAIEVGLVVCVPEAVKRTVLLNYPALKTHVFGGSTTDFARLMHAGKCDAAVIHSKRIEQLHAGAIRDIDCEAAKTGMMTEEEARCNKGRGGGERNDCSLRRVGDSIFNIPVAFPIRPDDSEMLTALSWALTDAQNSGDWEAASVSNSNLFPKSRCSTATVSAAQLDWDSFAGACFFAAAAAFIALTLHLITWMPKLIEQWAAARKKKGEDEDETEDVEVAVRGGGATLKGEVTFEDSGKGKGTGSSIEKNTPRKKRGSVVVDDVAGAGRAEAEQEKGAQSDESTREQMEKIMSKLDQILGAQHSDSRRASAQPWGQWLSSNT